MKKLIQFYIVLMVSVSMSQNPIENRKTKVFLLAGQSNMDGRAKASDLSEIDKKRLNKAQKNVTLYYNFDEGKPLHITKSSDYIKKTFNDDFVFGPELFFGIEMSEKYPDQKIILIKRSRGNMSLYGAWNSNWDKEKAILMKEENEPKLYAEFLKYSKNVLSKLDKNSYEICGMLWVQGEADSNKIENTKLPSIAYQENLSNLITKVRQDFRKPQLPFLLFQVGFGDVVKGMKTVAKNDDDVILIPQSEVKSSEFYFEQNEPPIWHYTTKSMKKIGEYFFQFYQDNFTKNINP
jgi:hypothetical protein